MKRIFCCLLILLNHCLLSASAQDIIFKEYDIRGVVGSEFTVEDSYDIACAMGTYLLEKDAKIKTIAVGADGRIHSPSIKGRMIQALLERGFDVIDIGTCTTPVLYFSLHAAPVDAGLIITASHNPGQYNGIKLCRGTSKVSGPEIRRIRDLYASRQFIGIAEEPGKCQKVDIIAPYIETLKNLFPQLVGANLHAIVDCGNGAAGTVMPLLVKEMQWDNVALLYPEVDGTFPHHEADPTVERNMQDLKAKLLSSDASVGCGFDGDGDRMAPMAKSGKLVKGDQLLTIFSKQLLEQYPGSSVVFDISSSRLLHQVITNWGGKPVLSATGIVHVKKKMIEENAIIGGEISCHTIFNDRYFGFDDGIYSMMRLFELLQKTEKSLDELLADFPSAFSSPLYRLPCDQALCQKIIDVIQQHFSLRKDAEILTIDGLRINLPYGWAIVRQSKTEPVISMRYEGDTEEDLKVIKKEFYALINPHLNCSALLSTPEPG